MLLVGVALASGLNGGCEEAQLNHAYRWFFRLGLSDSAPNHSTFSKIRHGRFRESEKLHHLFEATVGEATWSIRHVLRQQQVGFESVRA